MPPFAKTTNRILNSLVWLETVPVGSKIDIYVFERTNGQEVVFRHGKTIIKPWENPGVEGLQDLHHTYGSWVDLVAEAKVTNDRGLFIKLTVAIHGHTADAKASGGPRADQAFRGCMWG